MLHKKKKKNSLWKIPCKKKIKRVVGQTKEVKRETFYYVQNRTNILKVERKRATKKERGMELEALEIGEKGTTVCPVEEEVEVVEGTGSAVEVVVPVE